MKDDRWQQIESLCHAALARPAGERTSFLAEACGDDATLRAEVESLLAGADSAPRFMETPIIGGTSSPSLVGRQLGAYRIDAPIGAGGMGEVYRAKDTRLGRDVALKILPAAFAADPQRRSRFEREARAIGTLNHPNICTIHDVGHDQGIDFLVMELVEGESLAARLTRGPLPLDEALARAIKIADALDKAHRQGIVHRDLKPSNVMLARSGSGKSRATQAKLLDFGLARIMPSEVAAGAAPADVVAPTTETGAMLGTLQYMAPEQIEGQPADARTDIFAFGALLYEMLTGRRAFEGASTAALMAAILREDPPPVHPPEVGRIVRRCLAKDPIRRYQSARDLLNDLEDLQQSLDASRIDTSNRPPIQARRRLKGRSVRWLAIGLLGVATATAGYLLRPPTTPPSYRALTFQRGVVTGARFSPEGQTVYYSAAWGADPPRVYMTRLEGTGSVPIAGLPPATLLSVSSKGALALLLTEGRNLHSSGTLARASALGGTPRPLLDGVLNADWAPDGLRLAVLRDNYDLEFPPGRVLVSNFAIWPRISPSGDRVAYLAEDAVHVVDLEGRSVLAHKLPFALGLVWRPDGREIWFTGDIVGTGADRVLYALSLSGKRRVVATAPGAMTIYDIADDGTRALVATGAGWHGIQAGRADRAAESTLDLFGRGYLAGLSADGKWALLHEWARGLYLRSTDESETIRLSDDRGLGLSPDGRWALTSRTSDPAHLFLIPIGAGEPQQIDLDPALRPFCCARWSRDGRQIFMPLGPVSGPDEAVRIYRLDPPKSWRPVTPAAVDYTFAVSPDGRSIAALDRAGHVTLYAVDGSEPRTIAEERGLPIQWSADGRWLYLATTEPFRARVYRRELASGRVESWREIGPPDPAGVTIGNIFLSGDGLAYVYTYNRVLNVLYLVEGLE